MKGVGVLFMTCCFLLASMPVQAGIYKFTDSEGVIHFTNVPTYTGNEHYKWERAKGSGAAMGINEVIKKAARKYGIDAHLVKAVIKVESNFNPRAVSKKGAKGLMQIMPGNFKSLFIDDPFNPSQNIMAGTLYLKRLMDRYGKKLTLVLAAYNAGPRAVDRYKAIPPFPETQNYVRKVMNYYAAYKPKGQV